MRKHAILRPIHKPNPVHPLFSLKTKSRTHQESFHTLLKTRSRTHQKNFRNSGRILTPLPPNRTQTMKQRPRRIRPLIIPMKMRSHAHNCLRQETKPIQITPDIPAPSMPATLAPACNPPRLLGKKRRIPLYLLLTMPLTRRPSRLPPAAWTIAILLIRTINRRMKPPSAVRAEIPAGTQPFFSSATFFHLPYNFQPMTQATRQQQEARTRTRKVQSSCMNKRQSSVVAFRQFYPAADTMGT